MGGGNQDGRQQGFFEWFLHSQIAGSMVLLACTLIALVWANSPWADSYESLTHTYVGVSWGDHVFKMSLGHWVGDGLMVIFFFVVGLEIKREVVLGQLSTREAAILPVGAAIGGMVVPALMYFVLNTSGEAARGWGIPMATDIAFALGILSLFGSRVPIGLKVFLTALAVADDLGAVLVIAVFYTEKIDVGALIAAAAGMVAIVALSRFRVRAVWIYVAVMVFVWAAVLASGVHATVAGVLLAFLVPVRASIDPREFFEGAEHSLAELKQGELTRESMVNNPRHAKALDDLFLKTDDMRSPGLALEHDLHPVQSFLILPLFALFKAGIPLGGDTAASVPEAIPLGIIAGLVLGKPIGVSIASWIALRLSGSPLPKNVSWGQIVGAACLAGVGFTMSIFISELAFRDPALVGEAKLGVLIASLLAGVLGFVVLSRALPRKPAAD